MKLTPVCLLISACLFCSVTIAQKITLSPAETKALINVHDNQKLSLFVYDSLFAIWGINPFGNIRYAEDQHVHFLDDVAENYALVLDENGISNNNPGLLPSRRRQFTRNPFRKDLCQLLMRLKEVPF
jgi:hypothetical protein